jgi:NAD(P)-dependent dehydrogenase (short-subunit alcohol dehydrogenase family)
MANDAVALVIGASRGMGRAMCVDLARHGFDVVPTARTSTGGAPQPMSVEETAELVREQGQQALPLKVDLGSIEDVEHAVSRTMDEFGRIDTLVITANWVDFDEGGSYSTQFADMRWDSIRGHIGTTIEGFLRAVHLVLPIMIGQRSGVIMNITQNRVSAKREPRLPMTLEPPLTEWLGDPEQPLPNTGQVGSMVPIARGVTDRIAPALMRETAQHNVAVLTLDPSMTLSNAGMADFPEAELVGYRPDFAHSVLVPARAVTYLATCHNPMVFNGMFVIAEDLVRTFGLMTEDEIQPPISEGLPPYDLLPILGHPAHG